MTQCTNFPSENLVDGVTKHQVGNVTYLWKGGVWEAVTPPIDLGMLGGVSATFTTADGKTVTVTNGLITEVA